jgi:hypothetical protein
MGRWKTTGTILQLNLAFATEVEQGDVTDDRQNPPLQISKPVAVMSAAVEAKLKLTFKSSDSFSISAISRIGANLLAA